MDDYFDDLQRRREQDVLKRAVAEEAGFKILDVIPAPGVSKEEAETAIGLLLFGFELEDQIRKKRLGSN